MSDLTSTTTTYYLYVGNAWSGPFELPQIRFFLRHGQVAADTYAYDHDQQAHHTVGELLARFGEEPSSADRPAVLESVRPETRVFTSTATFLPTADDHEPQATATLSTATFENVGADLRKLYQSYLDLTEDRTLDRAGSLKALRDHNQALRIQLSAAVMDRVTLRDLCHQVARVGDYLGNRHQDHALWDRLEVLRGAHPENDPEDAAEAAQMVLDAIIERAEKAKPGVKAEIVEEASDRWEEPGLRTAKGIIADARAELIGTVQELEAVQQAYAQLQEQHAVEVEAAREALAEVESRRADQEADLRQALAEVRSLAAEVHRLCAEHLGSDPALREEIAHLATELSGDDATAMAPLAEGLLIRLIARLRNHGSGETTDVTFLREELASVRAELVQARTQALVLTEERDRLRRQLDEQRQAAERAMSSAREREQRLRSTVAAMEVTRDLHKDVMRELETQLTGAQARVSEMEGELSTVRVELKSTRTHLDERTSQLQDEMRRAVDLRAMLEARREELSANLRTAEAELQQAQGPDQTADPELVEALAAKVNHLRTTFEATKRKLDEQQALALRLEEELAVSRREAQELRGRSDVLTGELDDARANLSNAKRRFDELHRAYARLEQERESLQQEVGRKGTDTHRKDTDTIRVEASESTSSHARVGVQSGTQRLSKVITELEGRLADARRRLDQTDVALSQERDRARQASERVQELGGQIDELTAERDHLRTELDQLHNQHFADHSRHATSLAGATQATIDAERRAKAAEQRVLELELELAEIAKQPETSALEPIVRPPSSMLVVKAEAEEARADANRLRTELEALRLAVPAAAPASARLEEIEAALARTTSERDEQATAAQAATGERDRLIRELARLRNEHDSAAVEHRAALKSARDRLAESQARVQVLERDLEAERNEAGPKAQERDRLQAEVRRLTADLERTQAVVAEAGRDAGQERLLAELAQATKSLANERERVTALERELAEALRGADDALRRAAGLEERSALSGGERDRLTLEIERLKGELAMAQAAGVAARSADTGRSAEWERKLAEIAADRDHLLTDLSQITGELSVARSRLAKLEVEAIGAERMALEQARAKELEVRLAEARQESQASQALAVEARTRLAQAHAERDRLQVEVERLRAAGHSPNPDAAELAELRLKIQKLLRSRRKLRAERDALQEQLERAIAAVQTGTMTGQPAQRSPASPSHMDALDPMPFHADAQGGLTAKFSTSLPFSSGPVPPAFTSVHGRPSFPVEPTVITTFTKRSERGTQSTRRVAASSASRSRIPLFVAMGVVAMGGLAIGLSWWNAPVSSKAWLNASVESVTAPFEGAVTPSVKPGQALLAAQAMAVVMRSDPDRDALDAAEAALVTARRQVAESEAALMAWRQRRLEVMERLQRSLAAGTPVHAELAALAESEPTSPVAEARVAVKDGELAVQRERDAREARRNVTLAAPAAGTVIRLRTAAGMTVSAGDPVVELARDDSVMVEALLPSDRIPAEGTMVTVWLADDRLKVNGRVLDRADYGRSLVDVEPAQGERRVRIALDRLPAGVHLGQPVRVIYGDGLGAVLRRQWWLGE